MYYLKAPHLSIDAHLGAVGGGEVLGEVQAGGQLAAQLVRDAVGVVQRGRGPAALQALHRALGRPQPRLPRTGLCTSHQTCKRCLPVLSLT